MVRAFVEENVMGIQYTFTYFPQCASMYQVRTNIYISLFATGTIHYPKHVMSAKDILTLACIKIGHAISAGCSS